MLCAILWGIPIQGAVFLSEVQGNPKAAYDADGEYLEIAYYIKDGETPDSIKIALGEDSLRFFTPDLKGYGVLVVCKDSSFMSSLNFNCDANWNSLNIPNNQEIQIGLSQGGQIKFYRPPIPLEGRSWENTFPTGWESENWVESDAANISGDAGTPGAFYSGANLPFENDVYIEKINPDFAEAKIEFQLGIKNGKGAISLTWELTEDLDFDGVPDVILKKENIDVKHGSQSLIFSADIPADSQFHLYHIQLAGDSYDANNSDIIVKAGKSPLAITEVCPNPPEGIPEWFEIYNRGNAEINLSQLTYGDIPMGTQSHKTVLKAKQYGLITQDKELLESHYPHLASSIWEVSPWDILKNSGSDSLQLKIHGQLLTQMKYSYKDLIEDNGCLVPINKETENWVQKPLSQNSKEPYAATPGYQEYLETAFKYSLNKRIISRSDLSSEARLTIEAPITESYHVSLFDFNGYPVIDFGEFRGSETIAVRAKLINGISLQPDPYILLIEREGNRSHKIPIVVKI